MTKRGMSVKAQPKPKKIKTYNHVPTEAEKEPLNPPDPNAFTSAEMVFVYKAVKLTAKGYKQHAPKDKEAHEMLRSICTKFENVFKANGTKYR